MKKTILAFTLMALTPLSAFANGQNPLKTGAKELPIPIHASQAMKDLLKASLAPLNEDSVKSVPIPNSYDEWKKYIVEFDRPAIEQGRQIAKELDVTYEISELDGVEIYTLTPSEIDESNKNNLFLHIHGGAWLYGGDDALLREAVVVAHKLKIPVVSVNYRKAPDHPAPAALNDIITVWNELVSNRQADSIMMGGTSAGGNLVAASVLRMKDVGMPLPGALFIGTPSIDVQKTTDSRFLNDGVDAVLGTWNGLIEATVAQYITDLDPTSPYLSPIYGDFTDFPPTILVSGTRDLMLSDTVLLHRAIRNAGVEADLHIYEAHSHGFYMLPGEDRANFYNEMNLFYNAHISRYKSITPNDKNLPNIDDILIPEKMNKDIQ